MLPKLRDRAQFDKAFEGIGSHHADPKLRHDSEQLALLNKLILDFKHKGELIAVVLERMSEGKYVIGDDARYFFISCANEVYFNRLAKRTANKSHEDMSELHPLWGNFWFLNP